MKKMSTKRFRLTKASKILIMILIVALIGGGVFAGLKTGFIKTKNDTKTDSVVIDNDTNSNVNTSAEVKTDANKTDSDGTINLSLDEWIG